MVRRGCYRHEVIEFECLQSLGMPQGAARIPPVTMPRMGAACGGRYSLSACDKPGVESPGVRSHAYS